MVNETQVRFHRPAKEKEMKIQGRISQVRSSCNHHLWINVEDIGRGGEYGVGIWCSSLFCPLYLMRHHHTVYLYQFHDEKAATEWLKENKHHFDSVERLEYKKTED